jgi:glycosyltransferase involved in cell wall biosynthesis
MMIESFRRLIQGGLSARLCLVGGAVDAPDVKSYVAALRAEATGLPVEVHENLSCEELLKVYRRAAVYWHAAGFGENERIAPDRMEHFGISTVEAMAHGCVPIVIGRGGQPEIVEHGVDGLLWETREALVDATRRVLRDVVLARRLGAAAALKACRFSRAQFESRVHAFVSRVGRTARAGEAAA